MLRCADMWGAALIVLLVAYLPGAIIFRLPIAARHNRAALPAEERLFWAITISLALSSLTALALAASGAYRIDRLLWINGGITAALAIAARGRLELEDARWPGWSAAAPALLLCVAVGMFFFVPPAEYVLGGRDPGVYFNEGIQITQRGSLVTEDPVVRTVPIEYRRLFFPPRSDPRFDQGYDSVRFMGFFILDPTVGSVVGQFPHLYPAWVAIAYDTYGLTGSRYVLGLWAVFSVLAVYFVGVALLGRPAAVAGAGLLTLHVAQVWYARYPNAEIIMQGLIFAGLLAYVRTHIDDNRFFAPIAAVVVGLSLFAHITGILAIGGVGLAAILSRYAGHRFQFGFIIPLLLMTATAVAYYLLVLTPYTARPVNYVSVLQPAHYALLVAGVGATIVLVLAARSAAFIARARTWLPVTLLASIWLFALYALFLREGGGTLAAHDADGLRTFTGFYLLPLGLAAALLGWTLVAGRHFWTGSAFHIVAAIFAFFIFYKSRIVPEHFWMARRFLPIILPTSLLFVGAAAFTRTTMPSWPQLAWARGWEAYAVRASLGVVAVAWLGAQYVQGTRPVLRHIEFAGLIPKLEELAGRFTPDDLVLVESRGSSDIHVLATPLDYIYSRNVLVFDETTPDKLVFRAFLEWARVQYARVFFVGGGGTNLLSRSTATKTVGADRFQIPEYERALNAYPAKVLQKEFDYGIYEFIPGRIPSDVFNLDVGTADDLYVRRIHAKQQDHNGVTYRWTRDRSFVSVIATLADAESLTLHLSSGGRPAPAGEAHVRLTLNNTPLGDFTVTEGFRPYTVTLQTDFAREVALREEASELRIETNTWIPRELLGGSDDRDLGVMLDRVEIR